MATISSLRDGPWSSGTTWAGGRPPGDGDAATILHPVVVDRPVVVGTSPATDQPGQGTVACAGTALSGVGTAFTSQLKPGDLLNVGGTLRVVVTIQSDVLLTVGLPADLGAGGSFTFTPCVVFIAGSAGRLTVNAPLTVRGPLVHHWPFNPGGGLTTLTKVAGAGAGIEMDASRAHAPRTQHYPIVLQSGPSWSRWHLAGTANARVYLRSNAGGGNAYLSRWGSYYGSWQRHEYADLLRLGTADIAAGPVDMSQDCPEFVLDHCTVDACGVFTYRGMAGSNNSPAGIISVASTTFRNSMDATGGGVVPFPMNLCIPIPGVPGATSRIKGSVFDRGVTINTDNYEIGGSGSDDWNVFSGEWPYVHLSNNRTPCRLFRQNLLHMLRSANTPFMCPGTVEDCYILVDLQGTDINQHPCSMSGYYRHDLLHNVFEGVKPDPDCDWIQLPMPESDMGIYNIRNNIKLPNAAGTSMGTVTGGGNPSTRVAFEHNTVHLGGNVGGNCGGLTMGETYAGHAGMYASVRGNIFWDTVARDTVWAVNVSNFATSAEDMCRPGDFGYNGRQNAATGTHNAIAGRPDQAVAAMEYGRFSAMPGQGDVVGDPQFKRPGAGIAAWDLSLGGPGTVAHALGEMRKKNDGGGYNPAYSLPALMAFVRDAHRPANPAFRGATFPNTLGAVAWGPALPAPGVMLITLVSGGWMVVDLLRRGES